jgi:pimeloyl-ACP methyl ester carboxylesterase
LEAIRLSIAGLTISVRQTGTSGPAIVLVHGNSCSSRAFDRQLAGKLPMSRRLIAIDLPGHGESAPAPDPTATYCMPGYARVLVEVARQLDASNAVFFGWSLGGHVVLEASADLPRAAGFAIMGTPPVCIPPDMGRAFLPNPAVAVGFREDSSDAEIAEFLRSFVRPGVTVPPVFVEDFHRTDKRARSHLAASISPGGCGARDEIEIVKRLTKPLAVLHGEHEAVANGAYIRSLEMPSLWGGSMRVIAGAGHAAQWEAPEAFDNLLGAFAQECFGGS